MSERDFNGFEVGLYSTGPDSWCAIVRYRGRDIARFPLDDMPEEVAEQMIGRLALRAARGLFK